MKAEQFTKKVMSRAGISLNGNLPWDIQVHDDRFFDCVYQSASEGLGNSYVQGYWDSDDPSETLGRFIALGARRSVTDAMHIVHKHLKPNGVFLLHTIGENVTRPQADPWITKNIFPNGYIPSLSLISQCAEGIFVTEDVHNFNTSYEKTLLAWDKNFQEQWNSIRSLHPELDSREFYRMWRYYLNFCAGGFRKRCTQLFQFVFTRVQDQRNYRTPIYSYATTQNGLPGQLVHEHGE
jgi:hypothetical protein